mmetsp:Transcript_21515/g.33812  ORF Transcript_21515/g.33812 Transcript_21515/m.33812 type:complete len:512 (-) Transcript_21515:35-1570(-)
MALNLESLDTMSVDSAHYHFGSNKGLLVIRPGRSSCKTWFTIPEGMYALVTRHGADENYSGGGAVWPAGIHMGPPWLKVSHLITKQSVVFDMPVKGCKTMDNVTVEIDVCVTFRIMGDEALGEDPALVRTFVHEVTPRGLEQQLRDAQEEAVRALARSVKHTEVYGLRSVGTEGAGGKDNAALKDLLEAGATTDEDNQFRDEADADDDALIGTHDKKESQRGRRAAAKGATVAAAMKRSLNKQFRPQGVDISQVIIKNVKLPYDIESQMSNKTLIISENAQQKMNQQFEMQQLNQNEEMATLVQAQSEERDLEKQDGDKHVADLALQLEALRAEGSKQRERLLQNSRTEVQAIQAEARLEVTRLTQEKDGILTDLRAKSEAESAKLLAQNDVYRETTTAEAQLGVARNEAAAAEALADAEGRVAPMMRALKEHETAQLRLRVYEALSTNKDVVLSGSTDDNINSMLMADAILAKPGNQGPVPNRGQILAELAMLQSGSKVYLKSDIGGGQS